MHADRPPEPLTPAEHRELLVIIRREAPELAPLAQDAATARWLEDDEADALTTVLLKVFTDHLDTDDEPDCVGRVADDLIGRIEMQRRRYWAS